MHGRSSARKCQGLEDALEDAFGGHVHIAHRRCPALSCKALTSFFIDPEACKACLICLRKCPSEAIDGGKNRIHVIDQDKCEGCGICFDVCPPRFNAIRRISGEPVPPPWPEEQRMIRRGGRP